MSELSFEQMLDESFKTIHNGEVVEGTVIDVNRMRSSLTSVIGLMASSQRMNIIMNSR